MSDHYISSLGCNMKFFVVGDLHGNVQHLARVDQFAKIAGVESVIQVGDLGLSWPGGMCPTHHYFYKRNDLEPRWFTCLGNHDNWCYYDKLQQKYIHEYIYPTMPAQLGLDIVRRGRVLESESMLFLGGAVSTDTAPGYSGWSDSYWPGRKQNLDWWAQEAPSQAELELFLENLETEKPRFVFTHDAPEQAGQRERGGFNYLSNLPCNATRRALTTIYEVSSHKPEYWFYGHYHNTLQVNNGSTLFSCSGINGETWYYNDGELKLLDLTNCTSPVPFKELKTLL